MSAHRDPAGSAGPAALLDAAESDVRAGLRALTAGFDDLVEASAHSNADDEHDPEGATIAFERSQLSALVRHAHEQLGEIEAARGRLADGRYGRCETCGRLIPAERLEARPTARTCVTCAAPGRARPA